MTAHRFFLLVLSSLIVWLSLASRAVAAAEGSAHGWEAARESFAAGSPEAVLRGVRQLAVSGAEHAPVLLRALRGGDLRVDSKGNLFIVTDGAPRHAGSGEERRPVPPLRSVAVTNTIRRAIDGVLARLELSSKDPAVRLRAASELAQSPDSETAELVRPLLAKERDAEVRQAMALAVAKVDLDAKDKGRRLTALATIADSTDVSLKDRLEGMLETARDGRQREPDPEVRAAAQSALSAIQGRLLLVRTVSSIVYGLSLGSVLLLAALGLAITFGLMRVINMAHGEMLMLGAYATFVSQNLAQQYAPTLLDYYLVLAVPLAFVVTGLVGVLLERTVIRFLYGRPLETLLATWGLSLLLIQAVRTLFGAQNVTVANPAWLSGGWELMPMLVIPYSRLAVLAFTGVVVVFVWLVLQRTRLGLKVRAVTQNREIAASLGINTQRIDTWTFALGSAVAGLGGVALSQLGNVGPELGQQHIIDSFMVVVLGGVGNIIGAIVGGLGLGVVNKFLEPSLGAVLGKIVILGLLILFIQWRPQGLFALKGRAAEA